jgi:hypothetical protein
MGMGFSGFAANVEQSKGLINVLLMIIFHVLYFKTLVWKIIMISLWL